MNLLTTHTAKDVSSVVSGLWNATPLFPEGLGVTAEPASGYSANWDSSSLPYAERRDGEMVVQGKLLDADVVSMGEGLTSVTYRSDTHDPYDRETLLKAIEAGPRAVRTTTDDTLSIVQYALELQRKKAAEFYRDVQPHTLLMSAMPLYSKIQGTDPVAHLKNYAQYAGWLGSIESDVQYPVFDEVVVTVDRYLTKSTQA